MVVTFDPHPQEVLDPKGAPSLLSTWEEKARELERLGVHGVLKLSFDRRMAERDGREFLEELLGSHPDARGLIMGHDSRLGRGRSVGVDEIRDLAKLKGWELEVLGPVIIDGSRVSSTRIRRHLLAGEMDKARRLLGRPYSVSATVVRGAGRGKDLGFPTANLGALSERKLFPGDGVYAVWVERDREGLPGALSVGSRDSFGGGERVMEVHLIDFSGDLLGERLRLHLVERLRSQRRFSSVEELQEAMAGDCRRAAERLTRLEEGEWEAGFHGGRPRGLLG